MRNLGIRDNRELKHPSVFKPNETRCTLVHRIFQGNTGNSARQSISRLPRSHAPAIFFPNRIRESIFTPNSLHAVPNEAHCPRVQSNQSTGCWISNEISSDAVNSIGTDLVSREFRRGDRIIVETGRSRSKGILVSVGKTMRSEVRLERPKDNICRNNISLARACTRSKKLEGLSERFQRPGQAARAGV